MMYKFYLIRACDPNRLSWREQMREKNIKSISIDIAFDCGGRVNAVVDYRSIKAESSVVNAGIKQVLSFMMDTAEGNIRDQLPLFNKPEESEKNIAFENPFHQTEQWVNLRKKTFIPFLIKNFEYIKNCNKHISNILEDKMRNMLSLDISVTKEELEKLEQ